MPYKYTPGRGHCRVCGDEISREDNYCREHSGSYEHSAGFTDRRPVTKRGGHMYREGFIPAADGFNGIVDSPTVFLVGEAGTERVTVKPMGKKKTSADSMDSLYDFKLW